MSNWKLPINLKCPQCDGAADAATGIEKGSIPSPGSVCVCAYCGSFNKYESDGGGFLMLSPLSDEELNEIKKDYPDAHRELMMAALAVKMTMHD